VSANAKPTRKRLPPTANLISGSRERKFGFAKALKLAELATKAVRVV
jgi:hypothetical protein